LDGKTRVFHDPNPHGLLVSESNELLDGLKKLFTESDDKEQVRLLTIAPKERGGQKIENWYVILSSQFDHCRLFSLRIGHLTFSLFLSSIRNKAKLVDRLFYGESKAFSLTHNVCEKMCRYPLRLLTLQWSFTARMA
jgi:hypothetical protein